MPSTKTDESLITKGHHHTQHRITWHPEVKYGLLLEESYGLRAWK